MLELRNSHRNAIQRTTDRVVSIGDAVIVHDEDQTRGKWIGKVENLVTGSDGCVRGAVVRVKGKGGRTSTLRRPVQRLYPLEVQCKDEEPEPAVSSRRTDPVPTAGGFRAEQPLEPTCDRPRRAAAVEADRR